MMACGSIPARAASGDIAVLRVQHPAPGGWRPHQRTAFLGELGRLSRKRGIRAIVLTGAQIFEEPPPAQQNSPREIEALLEAVRRCPVPVIAAIPGGATGSGLELALACRGRAATPRATFSLPGILGGRIPGAATLAGLLATAGAEAATELAALGATLNAGEAARVGLVDRLAEDPEAAAVALAAALPDAGPEALRSDVGVLEASFFGLRLKLRRETAGQAAPLAALRALEGAASLPSRRVAPEVERISAELARSQQGQALAYAAAGAAALQALDPPAVATLAGEQRWMMLRECIHLLDEGATPAQIDRCLEGYGFPEGPFAESDRRGMAAVFSRADGVLPGGEAWMTYSPTLDLMADAGRHGGASAPGWYRPRTDASDVRFDPDVDLLIRSSAVCQRLHREPLTDDLVLRRCLGAASDAACLALHSHPRLSISVIDAIWTRVLGYPPWRGGPLYETRGTERPAQARKMVTGRP